MQQGWQYSSLKEGLSVTGIQCPHRHKVDLSRHQQRPFQPLGDVDTKFGEETVSRVRCSTRKSRVRCIDSAACRSERLR
jgi:hypothetical protein